MLGWRIKGTGLKTRILSPYDEFWDRRLGIRTFGFIPAVGNFAEPGWRGHYVPTPYKDIFAILRLAEIGTGDVFVDLGCGLGRVVFAAHWLGASRSIGVEIDEGLAAACVGNVARRRKGGGQLDVFCGPAEQFEFAGCTAVYMFHPFGEGTMRLVVDRLDAELRARPRVLKVVYLNPVYEAVLACSTFLKRRRVTPEGWLPSSPYAVSLWSS